MWITPFQNIPICWHICGAILAFTMFMLNRRTRLSNITVLYISQLPGIVLHESAHLLVGILFMASPRGLSLIPRRHRSTGGWTLGSVSFGRVTALNAVPIALAPISLMPLACYIYKNWFNWLPPTLPNTLILYATVFLLIYNSLPSRQDLRVACNWKSVLLYGSVGVILLFFWRLG